LEFIWVRLVSAPKRLEGVKNHNRMQAQRSLRKVAEKGVRLKGDTIMLFRLSGRWICCLQQYPRRRYACLGLCVDCPFGAFFSNQTYPN